MTKSRGLHATHVIGSASERFWVKVEVRGNDECWPWTAGTYRSGYGQFGVSRDRNVAAHVFAYEECVGPVPEGLVLDHLCHNGDEVCFGSSTCPHRKCCNPIHLLPRTRRANVLAGKTRPAANLLKTHCPQGHEYTPANTSVWNGKRKCRKCDADRHRARRARRG